MRWDLLSWVLEGNQRMAVIQSMICPMSPTLIHKRSKAHYLPKSHINSTSAVLRKFVKLGIARYVNNKKNKRRLYQLTEEAMKIRTLILKSTEMPSTSKQVEQKAHELGKDISFNNVSGILQELVQIGIATCLNPEKKRGKIYKLTADGEKIRKMLINLGDN